MRRAWRRLASHVPAPASSRSAARAPSTISGSGIDCAFAGWKMLLTGLCEPPPPPPPPPPPDFGGVLPPPPGVCDDGLLPPPGLGGPLPVFRSSWIAAEQRALDVVDRARVLLEVGVPVQMLDRLRVARDRVDAVDLAVVVEPVVDDLEPAAVRRRELGGRCGGRARGGRAQQRKRCGERHERRLRRPMSLPNRCHRWLRPRARQRAAGRILISVPDGGVPAVMPM